MRFCKSVCVVFAVQVKVEEVEMETPINPPSNGKQASLGSIKQEVGVEHTRTEEYRTPRQSGSENAAEERRKQSEDGSDRSEESSMQQSENKRSSSSEPSHNLDQQESLEEDSTMEQTSDSITEQDTTGEGAGMVGLDEEEAELSAVE